MTLALKYPLGIQTFSEIREENYVYVDKTAIIHELITTGKIYFLSRPRRFGKSLLISTLEALFMGRKALFDGLAIAETEYNYDFAEYPVVKLEFSKDEFTTADSLRDYIYSEISRIAKNHQIELNEDTYTQRFDELIVKLHKKTKQKVVLLVDEYDKPILNNFNKPVLTEIKQVIAAFYGVIKPLDEHLKFVFITGVSKFAKVSVFSGMNSLTDISMDRQYATLCGITGQELESYFAQPIAKLAAIGQLDTPATLAKIKHWYNGYRFEEDAPGVYNPYSLLSLFKIQKFKNYWYTAEMADDPDFPVESPVGIHASTSGGQKLRALASVPLRPTFLLNLLQQQQFDLKDLTKFAIGDNAFAASDPQDINILSVFVQTGYLTIKSYNDPLYTLDFPNYEVKKSFFDSVVDRYSCIKSGVGENFMVTLTRHLNAGRLDDFFGTLKGFFANIPYDLDVNLEKHYHALFYAIFTLMGFNVEAEVRTNMGRIDCVLQTDDKIYIIEFKLNDTKEAALQQILDKQYAQKYQSSTKEIVLLGVEFDHKTRNIGEYVRQEVK